VVGEVHITMRHRGRERCLQPWVPFGVGSGVVGVEIKKQRWNLKDTKTAIKAARRTESLTPRQAATSLFSHRVLARSAPWKAHCSSGCSTRPRISSAASTHPSRFTRKDANLRSGAEGIRTPDLRRAKSHPAVHRSSLQSAKLHRQAVFARIVRT
jgi:hypothetical protein